MMTDPLDIIEQGCWLCMKFLMEPTTDATGNVERIENGTYYGHPDPPTRYHPLQSVLISQPVQTGDWKLDAAGTLAVSEAWINGFIAGFAQAPEASADQDYVQGYLAAECLLKKFPRYFGKKG